MRPLHCLLPLVLILSGAAVAQKDGHEVPLGELVYRLVQPHDRLLTQELILKRGKFAVPLLVEAVSARDFRHGKRSWSDINTNPAFARMSGREICDQAAVAALQVLQALGAEAEAAIDPLLELSRRARGNTRPSASILGDIDNTVLTLTSVVKKREDFENNYRFRNHPLLHFHSDYTLRELVDGVSGPRARFYAACTLLSMRVDEVISDPLLRRQLHSQLIQIVRKNSPGDSAGLDWRARQAMLTRRGIHDRASELLARSGGTQPEAQRGHTALLRDIRAETRHAATIALGQLGGEAVPATFALIERLRDPVRAVQQAAIVSLGMIGPAAKPAIPHLRLLVLGQKKRLAQLAIAALRHIDPEPKDIWTYYHTNFKKQAEGRCTRGVKVGRWTFWNPDGSKQWEGTFVEGKMHGEWTHWDRTGGMIYRYVHGKLAK